MSEPQTTREAVETSLARLHALHEITNCVAAWNDEDALARADVLDRARERDGPVGPLHGLPIAVKDWIDVAGLPCTGGYEECRDRIPEADATVVARMRAAGAIVLAKTTVHEDTAIFGPVRNPRDPTHSPGFSSSGAAAAVAGGGPPVALGSDSGGSIRLPAAWCGAPALKPSAGLVPTTGHFPRVGERGDGRTVIGPIAARVRTLADVLAVIAGPDNRDAGCPPRRPRCGRRRRGSGAPHRMVARRRALDRLGCDLRCGAGCRRAARDPGRDDRR